MNKKKGEEGAERELEGESVCDRVGEKQRERMRAGGGETGRKKKRASVNMGEREVKRTSESRGEHVTEREVGRERQMKKERGWSVERDR